MNYIPERSDHLMALAIAWLIPLCLLIGWGLSM